MPFVTHDGRKLHYIDRGDGPVVLLAHSFLCSIDMWAAQIEDLSRDHRVIAVDARGHGESDPTGGPFTKWDAAADHLAVLDELGIDRAVFAGLSMGGMMALRAALRHPDRVAGLILVDSDGGPETAFIRAKYRALSWVAPIVGVAPLLPAVVPLMFGRTTRRQNRPLVEDWKQRWTTRDVPSMIDSIRAIANREDLLSRMPEIACPTAVIVGKEDKALPPERSDALATALGVHCTHVPGAGHLAPLEQPEAVTAAMRALLAGMGR